LAGRPSVPFQKNLQDFWVTTLLTSSEQDFMLTHFFQHIKKRHYFQRIAFLLWGDQAVLAKELLDHKRSPEFKALRLATRLMTKGAFKKDVTVEKEVASLSPEEKKWDIMGTSLVRFLIRADRGREALSVWLAYGFPICHDDITSSGPLKKSAQKTLNDVEVGLMRELIREANQLNKQGRAAQAKEIAKKALLTYSAPPSETWEEKLWVQGLITFGLLHDPKEALIKFLILAEYPQIRSQEDGIRESVRNVKGAPIDPKTRHRYRSRGYFWAGLCYEKMNEKEKARECFKKAARYPFFFYGQLAHGKLGRPLEIKFSNPPKEQGFKGEKQRELLSFVDHWQHNPLGRKEAKYTQALVQDLVTAARTPADAAKLMDILSILNPSLKVYVAKSLTADPQKTFSDAYPMCSLPVATPDAALIYSIALAETCFNPKVISSAGAIGIMQIMPHEAATFAKLAKIPYQPERMTEIGYGFRLGIAEINDKLSKSGYFYPLAIAAYNAGSHKVGGWLQRTPFKPDSFSALWWMEAGISFAETRAYTARVLEHWGVYRSLLKKPFYPQIVWRPCTEVLRKRADDN
jgi:soluble lytic murein transglycosylase-like protein